MKTQRPSNRGLKKLASLPDMMVLEQFLEQVCDSLAAGGTVSQKLQAQVPRMKTLADKCLHAPQGCSFEFYLLVEAVLDDMQKQNSELTESLVALAEFLEKRQRGLTIKLLEVLAT